MDICDQWKQNRTVNPRTNRKIKPSGKVYKDLQVECADVSRRPARRLHYSPKCLKWRSEPTINPDTNRKIKAGGPTYKKLEEECGEIGPIASIPVPKTDIDLPDLDECAEWKQTPRRNPRTRRAISPQGKVYKWYQKNCDASADAPTIGRFVDDSWFTQRLKTGTRINNNLRSISADQWDMCMTGSRAPKFRDNFSVVIEIGKGSFGQVYRAILDKDSLVVKEAYLRPGEMRILKQATGKNEKWELIKKNSYPYENRILDLVNQLLISRRCPNFVYVYNMAMCDGCKVERLFDKGNPASGSCYVTFMEAADTDLDHVDFRTYDEQLSILYQLLIAVYAIHHYYSIWHRDIKSSNVFVKMIKPGGYFEYVIKGKSYFVKNTGVVVYLADFGVSEVLSPLYAFNNYYGSRSAEVMDNGTELYWKPISLYRRPGIDWLNRKENKLVIGTRNVITDPKITSSVPINLNNSYKFPPFEFYDDIQDVIRIFVGGKQAAQPGNHKGLKHLNKNLKDLLTATNAYTRTIASVYTIHDTVKYILAEQMLEELYQKPATPPASIVDRFVM